MARTPLTVQQLTGPFPVDFELDAYTYAAADVGNGNSFPFTGKEIIIVRNVDGAATRNVTLTSVANAYNRTGNVTLAMSALSFSIFQASDLTGWLQTDGMFYLSGDNTNLEFAIVRLK